jgi:signal peptidase I
MIGIVVVAVAVLAALAVVLLRSRYRAVRVDGTSMEPTLHAGDVVLLARRKGHRVRAGQIVVVERPVRMEAGWYWRPRGRYRQWSVKRVAAAAGDPVPGGLLTAVNAPDGTRVPPGKLLLLGDHGAVSVDSRQWGYIPADRVLGVVVRL